MWIFPPLGLLDELLFNRVLSGTDMAAIELGMISKPLEKLTFGMDIALSAVAGLSTNRDNLGPIKQPRGNVI